MPHYWVCDQAGLSSLRHQGTLSTFIYYIATSNISDGTKICLDDANNWFSPYNPGCFGNIQMDGLPLCAVFPCLITFKPLYFSHLIVLAFLQEISCKPTFVLLISGPSCFCFRVRWAYVGIVFWCIINYVSIPKEPSTIMHVLGLCQTREHSSDWPVVIGIWVVSNQW